MLNRFLHTRIKFVNIIAILWRVKEQYVHDSSQLKSLIGSKHGTKLLEEFASTTFSYTHATFMSV